MDPNAEKQPLQTNPPMDQNPVYPIEPIPTVTTTPAIDTAEPAVPTDFVVTPQTDSSVQFQQTAEITPNIEPVVETVVPPVVSVVNEPSVEQQITPTPISVEPSILTQVEAQPTNATESLSEPEPTTPTVVGTNSSVLDNSDNLSTVGLSGSFVPFGSGPEIPDNTATTKLNKGKSKKKLLTIIGAVVGVVLLAGSVGAYTVINNSPDKILLDAFLNTTKKSSGSYVGSYKIDGTLSAKVNLSGGWNEKLFSTVISTDGFPLPGSSLKASIVTTPDKGYLKIENLQKLLAGFYGGDEGMNTPYGQIIKKIDNKWIMATYDELESVGVSVNKQQTDCARDALTKFRTDKKQQNEVIEVYKRNNFLELKKLDDEQVAGKSAYKMTVTVDDKKAEAFRKDIENTQVFKEVSACGDDKASFNEAIDLTGDNLQVDKDPSTVPVVTMWVDKSSRTLRKFQVENNKADTSSTKASYSMTLDYSKADTLNEPKHDITLKELESDFEQLRENPGQPVLGIKTLRL